MPRTKKGTACGGGLITGERRDLPDRTPEEATRERDEFFKRAWAQKRTRETHANSGASHGHASESCEGG